MRAADEDSFFGRLIQAAIGSTGGFGVRPLKRMGWVAKAAHSLEFRSASLTKLATVRGQLGFPLERDHSYYADNSDNSIVSMPAARTAFQPVSFVTAAVTA